MKTQKNGTHIQKLFSQKFFERKCVYLLLFSLFLDLQKGLEKKKLNKQTLYFFFLYPVLSNYYMRQAPFSGCYYHISTLDFCDASFKLKLKLKLKLKRPQPLTPDPGYNSHSLQVLLSVTPGPFSAEGGPGKQTQVAKVEVLGVTYPIGELESPLLHAQQTSEQCCIQVSRPSASSPYLDLREYSRKNADAENLLHCTGGGGIRTRDHIVKESCLSP